MLVGYPWHAIITSLGKSSDPVPSQGETQAINWTSQFINQFIPFAFGEMLRILLLQQTGVAVRVAFKSAVLIGV